MSLWNWLSGVLNYLAKVEFTMGGISYTTYDLPSLGHLIAHRIWIDYFPAVDAIVFLIDVSDRDRFEESREELDSLLAVEQIAMAPILVLGNKIDKPGAASEEEIRHVLGLHGQTTGKGNIPLKDLQRRPVELFMCSVLKREGYGEGFQWLTQYLS
ncbi:small COPII coat GTPase SAR1B-like isoform X2 [Dysidea avara]|uniref:small COPII coat GTPase SAR1B-like isoform X2 n=1 Tax=Dysidea avara TaxID=196820 RepID=UPI00331E5BB1